MIHRAAVAVQEQFITAKYVERRFVAPAAAAVPEGNLQVVLWDSVQRGSLRYVHSVGC
jgi:hypothetical protein